MGQSNLHMTLHISDLLAHQPVASSEEWTSGHFDVGGLAPWSMHQYSLQLEDQLGYKGKNFTCQPCRTLEEGEEIYRKGGVAVGGWVGRGDLLTVGMCGHIHKQPLHDATMIQ